MFLHYLHKYLFIVCITVTKTIQELFSGLSDIPYLKILWSRFKNNSFQQLQKDLSK